MLNLHCGPVEPLIPEADFILVVTTTGDVESLSISEIERVTEHHHLAVLHLRSTDPTRPKHLMVQETAERFLHRLEHFAESLLKGDLEGINRFLAPQP